MKQSELESLGEDMNKHLGEKMMKQSENRITKGQWIELCKKYNKWCNFCEVYDCTYEQAEWHIKTMPTLEPM